MINDYYLSYIFLWDNYWIRVFPAKIMLLFAIWWIFSLNSSPLVWLLLKLFLKKWYSFPSPMYLNWESFIFPSNKLFALNFSVAINTKYSFFSHELIEFVRFVDYCFPNFLDSNFIILKFASNSSGYLYIIHFAIFYHYIRYIIISIIYDKRTISLDIDIILVKFLNI